MTSNGRLQADPIWLNTSKIHAKHYARRLGASSAKIQDRSSRLSVCPSLSLLQSVIAITFSLSSTRFLSITQEAHCDTAHMCPMRI